MDTQGRATAQELLQACAGTELEMEATPNQTPICEFEVWRIFMPLETSAFEAAASSRWLQPTTQIEPETAPRRLVLTNVRSTLTPPPSMRDVTDGAVGASREDVRGR